MIRPSPLAYACGLAMGVLLLIASMYFIVDEWLQLSKALEQQKVQIRFSANVGWFVGGIVASLALVLLCVPVLLHGSVRPGLHGIISWMFVGAVFVGFGCRMAASSWIEGILERQGYVYCAEQSDMGPRSRRQVWVLDRALCNTTLDIDEMTLPELKDLLS